ncbi:MAG: thermonuclease family protein [Deltaproteobacteria bacterium]|nr:MAG: thermonuclease family protein [Deltaproteobacteria bacterium]
MASFWQRWFGGGESASPVSSVDTAAVTRPGTRLDNVQVLDVIDGDTIRVEINGEQESLRLVCLDTEESQKGSDKPVTNAGKLASEMAKKFFTEADGSWCKISMEFESNASLEDCLEHERGNYGRLICYVYKGDVSYNLHAIRGGWSPYFVKYGTSRFFHAEMLEAEREAQAHRRVIWDPATNAGGMSRDYETLVPWWNSRGAWMDDFRSHGRSKGALEVRSDYARLLEAMRAGDTVTLFCDLQQGITKETESGSVIYVGTQGRSFSLWIPKETTEEHTALLHLIHDRYARHGRGFVYVTGKVTSFRDKPQIVLSQLSQLSDWL